MINCRMERNPQHNMQCCWDRYYHPLDDTICLFYGLSCASQQKKRIGACSFCFSRAPSNGNKFISGIFNLTGPFAPDFRDAAATLRIEAAFNRLQ